MKKMLTAVDVAEKLSLDAQTVRRLARAGELPAARIAGSWRFDEAALEKMTEPARRELGEAIVEDAEQWQADATAHAANPEWTSSLPD